MPDKSKWQWREKREKKAFLAMEDGTVFRGYSVGAKKNTVGEVVFNTGMTGYQEILTDPSYNGQIVTMTYPEIGNTGVNLQDVEARGVFANGFIVHELTEPRNWRSTLSLREYLQDNDIPALAGIDTRALTTKLRDVGTLKALLVSDGTTSEAEAIEQARTWGGLDGQDYASKVSCSAPFEFDPDGALTTSWGMAEKITEPDLTVVAYDYGVKWNILRRLREQGIAVKVVPAKTKAADILAMNPDGLFLSNGPADPAGVTYAIDAIAELIGKLPIMGICLGHQLLGLAMGGKTERLKFGHHGCNQPVKDMKTGKVHITSQNHNFTVDPDTLPGGEMEVTHINLNDGTVEGLRHKNAPLFSTQFHPEAAPGPHDAAYLFESFRSMILNNR
ncbi:MAG: glutamine-hydrolyzing carbamoyl-phosphate synthase small subunit [Lentisphaeria bacterium]